MINYLIKFAPNLAQITTPLRELLKKEVEFILEKPQLNAIQELKFLVTSSPCLKYCNANLPTRLRPDASSEGLGALLEQLHDGEWYPVGFASRALREYEKKYAQIEKAVTFVSEKFHEYLYGHHFTVINGHQPVSPSSANSL